jgi:hypothetical protein
MNNMRKSLNRIYSFSADALFKSGVRLFDMGQYHWARESFKLSAFRSFYSDHINLNIGLSYYAEGN